MSDVSTVMVSNDDCVILGSSMPHDTSPATAPSIKVNLNVFILMFFKIVLLSVIFCKDKNITEAVLRHLVRIHIDGSFKPLMAQYLRGNRGFARPVRAGNHNEYRTVCSLGHGYLMFAAACLSSSK